MTAPGAPWRLLILDPMGDDPKWLIATVATPSDVRSAVMEHGGRRYTEWPAVTQWVRDQVGQRVRLVPIAATAWRIEGEAAGDTPAGEGTS